MERKLILIAGGSGSGKSTLAIGLYRSNPERFSVLHLDDYYKSSKDAPKLEDGTPNWDSADALDFDALVRDTESLLQGKEIQVHTKSELYNPAYSTELKNTILQAIAPAPILLLEGYLALYDERLRNLASLSIYLDMPIEQSIQRRSANKFKAPEGYLSSVLVPVHNASVAPTAQHADMVIDAAALPKEALLEQVIQAIAER